MFVLPLAILVATYAATFQTIANLPGIHDEHTARLQNGSALPTRLRVAPPGMSASPMETRRKLLARAKKKSLMITVIIVAAFVICWTPYYAMMLIFIFNLDPEQRIAGELQSAIFFF
ncbi:gonadotropin-releasing hormone receptor-like, partial [Tropilaelaps mercedesae]